MEYASFVTECSLPFQIVGAVKTNHQAQFHPIKYMMGLASCIRKFGGKIYTDSLVHDVKKDGSGYVCYSNEYRIKAKYVIIASHYPFINFPGFYFSKMYQVTSYALGIKTKKVLFDGMYIHSKEPVVSFRTAVEGDERLLIVSGGNHKTGFSPESEETFGYTFLEKEAHRYYPDAEVLYRWNTRDCVTLDKVPYIGNFSNFMPNVYVATGFNKWGMTSSNVAANIITDAILRKRE